MKRDELQVGQRLYYAKPYDWTHRIQGDQVEVISLEPVRRHPYSYKIAPATRPSAGVHVRYIRLDGAPGSEDVVRVQDLRGPYMETLAKVKAQQAADKAAQQREQDRAEKLAKHVTAVAARAVAEGASSARRDYGRAGYVEISADDLAALLDRLDAAERQAQFGAA